MRVAITHLRTEVVPLQSKWREQYRLGLMQIVAIGTSKSILPTDTSQTIRRIRDRGGQRDLTKEGGQANHQWEILGRSVEGGECKKRIYLNPAMWK